jgi:hypothetical protein
MGANKYSLIEKVMQYYKGGIVLEIGMERGEGSTIFLNDFCKKNNLEFYSVDFDPNQLLSVQSLDWVIPVTMTGEEFLLNHFKEKNKKIFFAYLDNFDYIHDHIRGHQQIIDQQKRYKLYGLDMDDDNHSSNRAHLLQTVLIDIDFAAESCFFLFDDTWRWRENEKWYGKGALAVPYLLSKDYKIIEKSHDDYNNYNGFVLLGRGY